MSFTPFFFQNGARLTQSFWGWVLLILAFIAALDVVLAAVFLIVSHRPPSFRVERQSLRMKQVSREGRLSLHTIEKREYCDLQAALEKLQDEHINAVLKSISLHEACIPGVWPLVKDRLAAHGVSNAYEASIDNLLPMRWLGEVPLRALLSWRASLETSAQRTMPSLLPPDQAAQIHARYEELRRAAEEGI